MKPAQNILEHGIPPEFICRDDRSTTTKENRLFGSRIANEVRPKPRLLISTIEYHTSRTALLSPQLKIPAQVLVAKAARYYLPAALLRGFIGFQLYESMRGICF
ncbi:YdcF family protein [Corynebacterium glutamicum]|uniref:ElyC/SanA/YdcF family protein n=1 Tax=Corynebacterium glutamicum TaxID=1718 RepID=UPI001C6E915C|nr:ElyC/SanA/YdcF family protein [Corynebacterium glutamicum]QYR18216.1 YdcF family protein [Corynebacterium glutamicum]